MTILLNTRFVDSLTPAGMDAVDTGPDLLPLLLDALAHGVMVVGQGGQVIHANQAACTELGRRRALFQDHGKILAVTEPDAKLLHHALAKAALGKRSLITLSGGGACLVLAVLPLKSAEGWDARIALMFARAEVCESGMFGFFARSHGLTQTEEQVLAILCRGLSTPEIAVQLKVAVSTVRSHVRSLCAKTGSSGVRELVNRVAVLPPVAPSSLPQIH